MGRFGLSEIDLRSALALPGCPLCRCTQQAQDRYLRFVLWERINDVGVRVRFSESLGYCRQHAQQFLALEMDDWQHPLGNSILYEDLLNQALANIRTQQHLVETATRSGFLQRLGMRTRRLVNGLVPRKPCRICEMGEEMALNYAETLVDMLSEPTFQQALIACGGVCLPHLRLLLRIAAPGPALMFVLQAAEHYAGQLHDTLLAYQQTLGKPNRNGPSDALALDTSRQAIAFLKGEGVLETSTAGSGGDSAGHNPCLTLGAK